MTHNEILAVVQAHKNGKQIQCKSKINSDWRDCYDNKPHWNFQSFDYRIKPEKLRVSRPMVKEENIPFWWYG